MSISITIDGTKIRAKKGITVLEAARKAKIYIPTLCAFDHLDASGSCRLCIVEIQGMKGYPTACTTPVDDGMVIRTKTKKIQRMRRQVLELTLSEHPYTCMVCGKKDGCEGYQGTIRKAGVTTGCHYCPSSGACELQELVDALKIKDVEFPITYRSIPVEQDDPFFDRDYNLCVLCGRCVRVCNDVRGNGTLIFGFRGEKTIVSTAFGKSHLETGCEFCGACVDVCPTGALYDKRSKWEGSPDKSITSICPYCAVGCSLNYQKKANELIRTMPPENGALNQNQLCVRGRFAIVDMVYHSQRLETPQIKKQGKWKRSSWDDALNSVTQGLRGVKGNAFAMIASPYLTNEDAYVVQKFTRIVMNSPNILTGGAVAQTNFVEIVKHLQNKSIPVAELADVDRSDLIIVWGADVSASHPILSLRIKQAKNRGARLIVIDPRRTKLAVHADTHLRIDPGADRVLMGRMLQRLMETGNGQIQTVQGKENLLKGLRKKNLKHTLSAMGVQDEDLEILVHALMESKESLMVLGSGLIRQEDAEQIIKGLINLCAMVKPLRCMPVLGENNLMGLIMMGCHPDYLPGMITVKDEKAIIYEKGWKSDFPKRRGSDFQKLFKDIEEGTIRSLYVLGDIPKHNALKKLDFLVVQSPFAPEWKDWADVLLPAVHGNETEGSVINFEGRMQRIRRIQKSHLQGKPDWWIIAKLAESLGSRAFSYGKVQDVFQELSSLVPGWKGITLPGLGKKGKLIRGMTKTQRSSPILQSMTISNGTGGEKGYPFTLLTGWNLTRYRFGSLTTGVPGMEQIIVPESLEIHPQDAKRMGVQRGDLVEVRSKDGLRLEARVIPTDRVTERHVFYASDHFPLNLSTGQNRNSCSVKIKKVADD